MVFWNLKPHAKFIFFFWYYLENKIKLLHFYCDEESGNRCLTRVLLCEARLIELTLRQKFSWSNESDEKANENEISLQFQFDWRSLIVWRDKNEQRFFKINVSKAFWNKAVYEFKHLPFSVGDPRFILLRLELKLWCRDGWTKTGSSPGRQVSTIASRQFTNNSDDSPIMFNWKEIEIILNLYFYFSFLFISKYGWFFRVFIDFFIK